MRQTLPGVMRLALSSFDVLKCCFRFIVLFKSLKYNFVRAIDRPAKAVCVWVSWSHGPTRPKLFSMQDQHSTNPSWGNLPFKMGSAPHFLMECLSQLIHSSSRHNVFVPKTKQQTLPRSKWAQNQDTSKPVEHPNAQEKAWITYSEATTDIHCERTDIHCERVQHMSPSLRTTPVTLVFAKKNQINTRE